MREKRTIPWINASWDSINGCSWESSYDPDSPRLYRGVNESAESMRVKELEAENAALGDKLVTVLDWVSAGERRLAVLEAAVRPVLEALKGRYGSDIVNAPDSYPVFDEETPLTWGQVRGLQVALAKPIEDAEKK